jgi:hypothetical protein
MTPVTVRLVVFNLDQQRELFRQEDFTADEIDRIAHAADGMEQWAVDYHVLLKPLGGWDLLSDLETKEIHATAPSDTVIFLGLPQASPEKMPSDMPGAESAQRFFYLQYRPALWGPDQVLIQNQSYGPARMRDPIMPSLPSKPELLDPIEESVRRLKGRIILVSSPAGFTKAIDSIEQTKNR